MNRASSRLARLESAARMEQAAATAEQAGDRPLAAMLHARAAEYETSIEQDIHAETQPGADPPDAGS
jgi:hypothetical protein